ncbi:FHA domain-containing protein [Pseudobutyrivibrio ruminis]|uniref:FHA domain-containing protein n=1 Tax=Pseudobutyrivibrio ruminis TaxID=46206 RepID=UPI0003F9F826|nr:FHA domain-containing protein [Pseudobutyrivibrio ruminis]
MKKLKRISTVVTIGAILLTFVPVCAKEETTAESAKSGVVQVNTVIVDSETGNHVVIGGAGFLIGDSEGTEYVITSESIVNPSHEVMDAAYDFYGITITDDNKNDYQVETQVAVESDVALTATVLTESKELNMAVLQLPQPIYTKTPLSILTNKEYDVNNLPYEVEDAVFQLGFPAAIGYDSSKIYYNEQDIRMATGEIQATHQQDGVQVIDSNAAFDYDNYGGPVVNENGYVIGMNLYVDENGTDVALDSTKIVKILDGLGVQYSQVNTVPKKEEVEPTDQQAELKTPTTVVEKKSTPIGLLLGICVGAVVLIAAVVTVIIIFVFKKDGSNVKKEKSTYNGPVFSMDNDSSSIKMTGINSPLQTVGAADETTILNMGPSSNDGETTLLSGDLNELTNLGTLIRKRTSERISINKKEFVLGKDALHSDYCIENNSSISRKHAVISYGRNGVYIQDCNSTNGTFINGMKLESERTVLLNTGDVIRLSNEEFEYQA